MQELGINLNAINPKKNKSFWNGGKCCLSNNIYYPSDLTENAIQLIGENDGSFDNEDYILCRRSYTYNVESQTYNNLYDSKSSYYYITTSGDGKGLRKKQNQPPVTAF
jgi:hypothetical protein